MMFHGYVRLPESKWFSRKNIIIWVKLYQASGNFIRQQKNTSSTGQCWEIYHAYTMHHHGPIGRLRSKCNAPSLKFLLFQLDHSRFFSGIFKGQSYHLGHLLAHWGFVGKSCSLETLKMSLFQNPQLLFSGYSCLANAFQSFWVVLLLVDLLVWMGCIKNMARPLHSDRM